MAEGFDSIGSAVLDKETGHVYVSDEEGGFVAEVRPKKEILEDFYLLKRSLQAFE